MTGIIIQAVLSHQVSVSLALPAAGLSQGHMSYLMQPNAIFRWLTSVLRFKLLFSLSHP